MFGAKISEFKKMFFDRAAVMSAADRAELNVLSKFGAFVRRTARSSVKKVGKRAASALAAAIASGNPEAIRAARRGTVSTPGNPPKGHGEELFKKWILFGYDREARSVVIGPARLNSKTGEALPALEYGGTSHITGGNRDGTPIKVAARPTMQPAFNKNIPTLPPMWRNSIHA